MSTQSESSFVSTELVSVELFHRYPAIDEVHLKAIKENKFKPINLVKLTTEMTLDRSKVKVLTVGSDVASEARKEDALSAELKGIAHLIRCFLIYTGILLHFTHNSLEKSLCIGMLAYVERLWNWSNTYTFDSIRQYHFLFHSLRIWRGIDDGSLWEQSDSDLKDRTLRVKPQSEYTTTIKRPYISGQGQFQTGSNMQMTNQINPATRGNLTCHRWNGGIDCFEGSCKFKHLCDVCNGNHRAKDCCFSNYRPHKRPSTQVIPPSGSDIPPDHCQ